MTHSSIVRLAAMAVILPNASVPVSRRMLARYTSDGERERLIDGDIEHGGKRRWVPKRRRFFTDSGLLTLNDVSAVVGNTPDECFPVGICLDPNEGPGKVANARQEMSEQSTSGSAAYVIFATLPV
jgi:hypothetical protein